MFIRAPRYLIVITVVMFIAGCGGTVETPDGDGASVTESQAGAGSGASTSGLSTGSGYQGNPLDDPASPLSRRTVYFDYDSDNILASDRSVVEAHARYLADNPDAALTLEGHADERGSREYNVALGERRASSVRQLMSLLGASGTQMRMVSYGEERPVVDGLDDESYSLNRRVEIIYRQR